MIESISKLCADRPLCISIVGAGGKTTLMSMLAKQLPGKTICTTTTKLAFFEADLFSKHLDLRSRSFEANLPDSQKKSLLISNGTVLINQQKKLLGLSEGQLSVVWKCCQDRSANLLIEADGAKRRLLKAPADWEPVIPEFSDLVIYVFGPNILGLSLNEENVFRSHLFSEIVGSEIGEMIDSRMITSFLIHSHGAQKGIPLKAKKILFSNRHCPISSKDHFYGEELQELVKHFDYYFDGNLKQTMLQMRQVF
jgi:probable selenium-dependent hydroxylase accessory protein YqeC